MTFTTKRIESADSRRHGSRSSDDHDYVAVAARSDTGIQTRLTEDDPEGPA